MTTDNRDEKPKPRVKFCWWCGRKLHGNSHVLRKVQGEIRTLHKECAKHPETIVRDDEELNRGQ